MTAPSSNHTALTIRPLDAVLAWVLPGLGHWLRGEHVRAYRVFAGMAVLILGGLLIGGVDVVDATNDRLWFIAQLGAGPIVLGLDAINQGIAQADPADVAWRSLGHVNSVGTLSIGLAGMLNVVVVLDALYPRRHVRARRSGDDA